MSKNETMKNYNSRALPSEHARWEEAAKKEGRTLSNWKRWHLNKAAETESQ